MEERRGGEFAKLIEGPGLKSGIVVDVVVSEFAGAKSRSS